MSEFAWVYKDPRWRIARARAKQRDKHRCTQCGRAGVLEVHHIVPLKDKGEPFDLLNLATLCVPCHTQITALANTRPEAREWKEHLANY